MKKNYVLLFILALVICLTGCKSTLQVYNATVKQIHPLIEDYVGLHGFQITYHNEQTGSYRISLGLVYVPNTSQTVKTSQGAEVISSDNVNQTSKSSVAQTTWQSVNMPSHYVESSATLRVIQQDNDVMIYLDENSVGNASMGGFIEYLRTVKLRVDSK